MEAMRLLHVNACLPREVRSPLIREKKDCSADGSDDDDEAATGATDAKTAMTARAVISVSLRMVCHPRRTLARPPLRVHASKRRDAPCVLDQSGAVPEATDARACAP